jgi:polyisoprenoid-binding protein YceI
MKKTAFVLLFPYFSFLCVAQQLYTPVDAGSKIHFVIKNFAIKTGGDFSGIRGAIYFDPAKPAASSMNVSVDAATVDTDSEMRDDHLKEDEYFDAAKYPTINFKSTKISTSSVPGKYFMVGNLTIKGITKPVEFGFSATPKDGGYLFDGEFAINRLDYKVGDKSFSLQDNVNISLKVFAKK